MSVITYPLAFPSGCASGFSVRPRTVVAVGASPFTGQQQVYQHQGQWWEADVQVPPLKGAVAERMAAFITALRGRAGTFTFGDPYNTQPRGTGGGTPLVAGASQTGDELMTDGWPPSERVLVAGDWVQVGTQLCKVLADVVSNSTGVATLPLFPAIRSAPDDNAALVINNPVGLWRLASNDVGYGVSGRGTYSFTLPIVEAL